MTATFAVTFTNPDAEDRDAARLIVNEDNLRRQSNALPVLPTSPAAALRASYETVLIQTVSTQHIANVSRSKTVDALRSNGLTDPQINQLAKAASDRISNGESFNSVLTDLQTP